MKWRRDDDHRQCTPPRNSNTSFRVVQSRVIVISHYASAHTRKELTKMDCGVIRHPYKVRGGGGGGVGKGDVDRDAYNIIGIVINVKNISGENIFFWLLVSITIGRWVEGYNVKKRKLASGNAAGLCNGKLK